MGQNNLSNNSRKSSNILIFLGGDIEKDEIEQEKLNFRNGGGFSESIYSEKIFQAIHGNYSASFFMAYKAICWYPKYTSTKKVRGGLIGNDKYYASYNNTAGIRNKEIFQSLIFGARNYLIPKLNLGAFETIDVVIASCFDPLIAFSCWLKQKFPNIKVVLNVPDLPTMMNYSTKNVLYKAYKNYEKIKIESEIKKCVDGFVFLSKYMIPYFSKISRPYFISEGIAEEIHPFTDTSFEQTIVYTGLLEPFINLDLLLKSFSIVKRHIPSAKLIIAGGGGGSHKIEELSQNGFLIYKGVISPEDAKSLQLRASVLINLRAPDEVFKYSFPSKTMSYLETGHPVVCFKLGSFPAEYDDVLFYPKSDSVNDVASVIESALRLTAGQREKLWKDTGVLLASKNGQSYAIKMTDLFYKIRCKE